MLQENAFENIVCNVSDMLSSPQYEHVFITFWTTLFERFDTSGVIFYTPSVCVNVKRVSNRFIWHVFWFQIIYCKRAGQDQGGPFQQHYVTSLSQV